MPIPENTVVPNVRVHLYEDDTVKEVMSHELFAGRTVVAFGLPGAFTPTCSALHLPGYEELAPSFREHGVDTLLCITVNDPYVAAEWARQQNIRNVGVVADGNGEFTRSLDLLLDRSDKCMGQRSRRYSMLVRDGKVQKLFIEPLQGDDPYSVSDADTMLSYIAPDAARPPRIVVFSKAYCPHSLRARRALDERGWRYVEFTLGDADRSFVLGAVSGASSTPQVFIDGQLIGGADALQRYLESAAGSTAARTAEAATAE
jgi:peroxiredoxin